MYPLNKTGQIKLYISTLRVQNTKFLEYAQ